MRPRAGESFIFGAVLITLAMFFSGSIAALLKMFPPALVGVILVLPGTQLAQCDFSTDKTSVQTGEYHRAVLLRCTG